jgi:hypothetical protein
MFLSMRAGACAAAFLLSAAPLAGAGFFDGVPGRGYVAQDLSLDVITASAGSAPVARVRYLRLSLDPQRRDVTYENWPQREILMVEHAAGEKLVFERITRLPADVDAAAWVPRGRIGLSGGALETFGRGARAEGSCGGLDVLVRAGSLDLPLASADLDTRTVRTGIGRAVEAALSPRDVELVASTVPILYAARTRGLPAAPLDVLGLLFPGRAFAQAAQSLTFRPSGGAPLNPADGAWRSVTTAPEMLPGVPAF